MNKMKQAIKRIREMDEEQFLLYPDLREKDLRAMIAEVVKIFAIPDVVGQSEQLKAFMDFAEWYKNEYKQHIPLGAIKEYIKSL